VLIVFLLVNKVYSPRFSLWLLPWMALALPGLGRGGNAGPLPFPSPRALLVALREPVGLFALFQVTEVAVFVIRFTWFNLYQFGDAGPPEWAFETAVLARDAVLVLCLWAWTARPSPAIPALEEAGPPPDEQSEVGPDREKEPRRVSEMDHDEHEHTGEVPAGAGTSTGSASRRLEAP
jgi:hypothetical protein